MAASVQTRVQKEKLYWFSPDFLAGGGCKQASITNFLISKGIINIIATDSVKGRRFLFGPVKKALAI